MAKITIESHEIEGVIDYAEWELESDDRWPRDRDEWRSAYEYIGWLLDLQDALRGAEGSVEIADSPFLADFAKGAGEFGRSNLALAFGHKANDPEGLVRTGKGMVAFAERMGVYEGVTL